MIGAQKNPGGMAWTMAPRAAGSAAPQMMAPQPAAGITPIVSFAPGTPEAYRQQVYDRWGRTGSLSPQGSPYGQQQDPYGDIQDLMRQYPGVDPNELRRFREMQKQAQLGEAADRFRQDQAAVAPPYERARQEQNKSLAEQFAQKNEQQYGYRPMGSPGGSTYKPGMAQPIPAPSQGTPYQQSSPFPIPGQQPPGQAGGWNNPLPPNAVVDKFGWGRTISDDFGWGSSGKAPSAPVATGPQLSGGWQSPPSPPPQPPARPAAPGTAQPRSSGTVYEDARKPHTPYDNWGGGITAEDEKAVIGGPGPRMTIADWKRSQARRDQNSNALSSIMDEFSGIDMATAQQILQRRQQAGARDSWSRAQQELGTTPPPTQTASPQPQPVGNARWGGPQQPPEQGTPYGQQKPPQASAQQPAPQANNKWFGFRRLF